MPEQFHVKELPNGMTLVGQPMENVSSAAMTFQVCSGASRDAAGLGGTAAVAAEWVLRGAGDRDTR
ncbi:MAG: insulinase family protein, partial [Phycisphaerae bacterium]|nr:insulinase family protein [Phycisphaerae bacterium]